MDIDEFIKPTEDKETIEKYGMIKREGYIPYIITPDSHIFNVVQQGIDQSNPSIHAMNFSVLNQERTNKLKMEVKDEFQVRFDWIDENTCGIEVFKKCSESQSV